MHTRILILLLAISIVSFNCDQKKSTKTSFNSSKPADTTLIGIWLRMSPVGPVKIHFKENGLVTTDLGDDNIIDVTSRYVLKGDTIQFTDSEGKTCPDVGIYKVYNRGYTLAFDVLDDLCNGRIKATAGFWVRPSHKDNLEALSATIEKTNSLPDILHRGRMYLALGRPKLAFQDFDNYIKKDTTYARVYVHRAATRFPNGLKGIVSDCSKAIELDASDKNAFFLRGLAYYGLGEEQKGCDDFKQAIAMGFEILKEAEYNKCKDYW